MQNRSVIRKPTKIPTSLTEECMSALSGPKQSQFRWAEYTPLRRSRKVPPRLSRPFRSLILGTIVGRKTLLSILGEEKKNTKTLPITFVTQAAQLLVLTYIIGHIMKTISRMASILQRPEFSCKQERLLQNQNSCHSLTLNLLAPTTLGARINP